MAKQFTLGKTERLKSRKQIEQLFKEGKRFASGPFRIFYIVREGPEKPRFGIGVGTRSFKRAVDRNRIKRMAREAWRLQKGELEKALKQQNRELSVFFVYTGKELPDYTNVYEGLARSVDKLTKIIT